MSITLAGEIKTTLKTTSVNVLDLSTPKDILDERYITTLASGTGADQANLQWHDSLTWEPGIESLDLTALSGGAFGTCAFTKVKAVIIKCVDGTAVMVRSSAMNGWTNWLGIAGVLSLTTAANFVHTKSDADGVAVAANNKVIELVNSGAAAATVEIIIIGVGTVG